MTLSRNATVAYKTFLALLVLLAPAAASAQTITASPASLFFAYQTGQATPAAQSVQIGGTAGLATTITVNTGSGPIWLLTNPQGTATTPYTMQVFALPSGLAARAEPYTGTITISAAGAAPVVINVQLIVSSQPVVVAAPTSLSFTYATNGPEPQSQLISLSSTTPGIGFSAAASTTSNVLWLNVTPLSGSTPSQLTVSVNRTGLAVGTYTGAITIAAPGAGNPQVVIPVTFQVTEEIRIVAVPAALTFDYQLSGPNPQDRVISLTSTGVPSVSYTAAALVETPSGGTWLTVNPASGNTTANLTVSAQPTGLAAGNYSGVIRLTAAGATNSPINVPVTLRVTADPLLRTAPSALTFTMQVGGAGTQTLPVLVSNLGNSLAMTAAAEGNWLSVVAAGPSTPSTVLVQASASGLPPGVYQGQVTVTAGGAANSPFAIPVSMIISATPHIRVDRQILSFVHQSTGQGTVASQVLKVTSTGAAASFKTAAVTSGGGSWLSATPATATTPSDITVAVNPAGLGAGLYSGTISVTPNEVNAAPVSVEVRLLVSQTPILQVSPGPLTFVAAGGTTPAQQTIQVSSTGAALPFTAGASTSGGGDWLVLGPTSGATPTTVFVGANPLFQQGTFTGVATITALGVANSPQYVPVIYTVTTASDLTVSPATLNFTHQIGGTAAAPQTISLTSAGNIQNFTVQVTAVTGGNWLSVTPGGGITPANLTATVNASGLDPGTYAAIINILSPTASNSPRQIPVTLTVTRSLPSLNVSNTALSFTFTPGANPPSAQIVQTTSSNADTVINYNVNATTSSGAWLQATPATGSTPGNLNISVNPAGLAPGGYTGTVTLTSAGASNSPRTITVNLTVVAVAAPQLTAIVHAATFLPVPAAPGLIVTLFGSGIGPERLAGVTLTGQGNVATETGRTRVLFDGFPAPMIYASATQTSAVVPYQVANRVSTRVVVEYNGVASNPIDLRVADAAPGIFTQNASGKGLGAILNQDGSINGAGSAAPRDSVIVVYASGEGQTTPGGVDGQVTGTVLKRPLQTVTARIGGVPCEVLYAGSAPGFVSGALQINIRVSPNVPAGTQPIEFSVGSITSAPEVTVAIR